MRPHGQVRVNPRLPRSQAVCDRCGAHYNHSQLSWQFQWAGPKLRNVRILVCPGCLDRPQEGLRTIVLPPDPIPIDQPRPEAYTQDDSPITGLGVNIGTLTEAGGLAAAFNGRIDKPSYLSAMVLLATAGLTNTVGKWWGVSAPAGLVNVEYDVNVTSVTIYAPNDRAISSAGIVAYTFDGSSDGSTWTTLVSGNTLGTAGEVIPIAPSGTAYPYHRVAFDGGAGGGSIAVAQMVIYGTGLSGAF